MSDLQWTPPRYDHSYSGDRLLSRFKGRTYVPQRRILHSITENTAVCEAVLVASELLVEGHFDQANLILEATYKAKPEAFLVARESRFHAFRIHRLTTSFNPSYDWFPRSPDLPTTLHGWELAYRRKICGISSESHIHESAVKSAYIGTRKTRWETIRALTGVRRNEITGHQELPSREEDMHGMQLLEQFLVTPPYDAKPDDPNHDLVLCLAVELTMKYKMLGLARAYLGYIAGRIADGVQGSSYHVFDVPHAGPLFAERLLEKYTKLSPEKAQTWATSVAKAVEKRLKFGEQRPWKKMSWKQLVSRIREEERLITPTMENVAVLPFRRGPASKEAIEEAEARLGVALPQDFKNFLAYSNGLGSYDPYSIFGTISRVEDIDWDDYTPNRNRLVYRALASHEKLSSLPFIPRVLDVSELAVDDTFRYWFIEPHLLAQAKTALGDTPVEGEWLFVRWLDVESYGYEDDEDDPDRPKGGFDWNMGSFRTFMERRLSYTVDIKPPKA